jgi:hypothetical protein
MQSTDSQDHYVEIARYHPPAWEFLRSKTKYQPGGRQNTFSGTGSFASVRKK